MNSAFDALALAAIPIMCLVGVRRQDLLLLMWLVLSPLQDSTDFFGVDFRVVSFDRLAFFASVVSMLISGRLHHLIPNRFSSFEKAALWFIAIFLIQALLSFDLRDAFSMWMNACDLFAIPLYLYFLIRYLLLKDGNFDDRFETKMIWALAIVGVYCACMGMFEQVTKIDVLNRTARGLRQNEEVEEVRANGPFDAPGVYGLYLNFILLFVIYYWRALRLAGKKVGRWITIPFSTAMIGGIYSVMFRNIWGGFLGGFLIQTGLNPRLRKKFVAGLIVTTMLGACFWGVLAQTQIYQNRLSNVSNVHDRLNAWAYSFRAFSEHPFIGIGYGRLKFYIRGAQEAGDDLRWFDDIPATHHPHNTVVAMLGENGMLLTIPFLAMIGFISLTAWRCLKQSETDKDLERSLFLCGAVFAMLAPHMTDRCLAWIKYNNLLFLFFGMVAAHHFKLVNGWTNASDPVESEIEEDTPEYTSRPQVVSL